MTASLLSSEDLEFLLYGWLNAGDLVDEEILMPFLELSEKLAEKAFLPHYKLSDRDEPSLTAKGVRVCPAIAPALRQYAELGFFAASFPEEFGGLGLTYLACSASFAYFAAANVATAAYPMLTVANARLITVFGNAEQIERFALPQISGEWFGTMCLSEPQAGSSLADLKTRAVPDGNDALGHRYLLTGNKMWISGGDQDISENIVHLVLAKVPDGTGQLPDGTQGISLFIVPKLLDDGTRNDVSVAGLNHKMGYRGTANCLLNFGERDGAVGWIVGAPGQGLRQMFKMMNEARIGVGVGAAALAYRSYRLSVQYAKERSQGRPVGVRTGPPVPIVEHVDVRQMLLAQKSYAEGALALCLYCARLVDVEADDEDAAALLSLLTPVAKTWSAEFGLAANDIAIQIHGGYGYTRDFDVEQLWRDNRLNPIHEGTTGIQGIDLLGRKILRDKRALAVLAKRLRYTAEQAEMVPELAGHVAVLRDSWARVETCIGVLSATEATRVFDNATPFLRAFGHLVVAWLWLDQARAALALSPKPAPFAEGKMMACRYFFEFEVPRIAAWLAPVKSRSDIAASIPTEAF